MALFNFQCQNDTVNVLYLEIRNVFHKKLQTNCELVRYPILGTTTSDMLEPPAGRKGKPALRRSEAFTALISLFSEIFSCSLLGLNSSSFGQVSNTITRRCRFTLKCHLSLISAFVFSLINREWNTYLWWLLRSTQQRRLLFPRWNLPDLYQKERQFMQWNWYDLCFWLGWGYSPQMQQESDLSSR